MQRGVPLLVVAVEQERLDRIKYSSAYPTETIEYCLRYAGIGLEAVDLVVGNHRGAFEEYSFPLDGSIETLNIRHLSHAASAYCLSGFRESAILTLDGGGSQNVLLPYGIEDFVERQAIWKGIGNDILEVSTSGSPARPMPGLPPNYPLSIGNMYDQVTRLLGWSPFDAGKTMGLASYASDAYPELPVAELPNGHSIFTVNLLSQYKHLQRSDRGAILPEHQDLARLAQRTLEEVILYMANSAHRITNSSRLCVAGGVFLNGLANYRILRETPFEEVYFFPACNDGGIAIGNALYGYYLHNPDVPRTNEPLLSPYFGCEYNDRDIESLVTGVDGVDVRYCGPDGVVNLAATKLGEGQILGWFQGRSEIGPRALENRSILADPSDPRTKDRVNSKVKHREPFRPFAPSVPEEYVREYFDLDCRSPFMLLVAPVRDEKKALIPAVTHVDGTARVHTVRKADNPRFHDLLSAFGKLRGTPILLNTSFNDGGQPMVETPLDALLCFLRTGLDSLAIGNWFLSKTGGRPS